MALSAEHKSKFASPLPENGDVSIWVKNSLAGRLLQTNKQTNKKHPPPVVITIAFNHVNGLCNGLAIIVYAPVEWPCEADSRLVPLEKVYVGYGGLVVPSSKCHHQGRQWT